MLRASVKLLDRRIGTYEQVKHEVEKLGGSFVKVGFPSEATPAAGEAEGISEVAQIAAFNEFGTSDIPERPFFRQAIDNSKAETGEFIDKEYNAVMRGERDVSTALERIGLFMQAKVQTSIRSGDFVPLHPATIAAKGSSKPLIDTAQMIGSVSYVVKSEK